ncbi:MAG: NnrS family protein [Chthoniobacterales bacterium]|nr:NnrS family protein [Chthoniobacterales bacterium]
MSVSAESESPCRRYWRLVNAGEPFRLLFPLGALLGILGVAVWPLHVWGFAPNYPGQIHARIMIECFLTSFVIGFLGTALPRVLDVRRLGLAISGTLAVVLALSASMHLAGHGLWGDIAFAAALGAFVAVLLSRARQRKDIPPPSFVLVGMGLLAGIAGAVIQILDRIWPMLLAPWVGSLGRALLHQAYPLLPVMGVGAFLLPRFFGLRGRQDFPELLRPSRAWLRQALLAFSAGVLVLVSLLLEARGYVRPGYALRLLAVAGFFASEIPQGEILRGRGTLALGVKIALVSIPAGYALLAFSPSHYFAWLHVVFVTGFSLLIFVVACRVVFGHGGQSEKFRARLWPILAVIALLLLAAATRVSADWMDASRLKHYAYAAIAWSAGAVVWFMALRRTLASSDED